MALNLIVIQYDYKLWRPFLFSSTKFHENTVKPERSGGEFYALMVPTFLKFLNLIDIDNGSAKWKTFKFS